MDADSERRRDRTRAAETRAADVIAEGVWDAEPREIPGRLCAVAVDLLPVVGASVALHSDGLPVRLSASSERAARLAEIQATLGEGPCQYAAGLRAPVQARDLTAGPDARRWPLFAQQATAAGIQAAYSMPLGIDTVCVGTLDLYSDTPGELTGRDLHTALLVAGVMTVALMALPRGEGNGGEGDEPWLSGLATDQDEVYQAVGMTMAQLGSDADEALARLRAHAFADSRTVLEVARDVVAHRMRLHRD
ncbi:GAF and ANTAR domain-containing protein [Streptomyces sp. NPDC050619]|uniref:GAF and ANTAR domain-containing protein n=1 Tax=Streptomyces sp. NPDC050619 TaxID=3157214 RepID=UPI0034331D36